jgi:EmrB/QacA subfamily drug resistance transporter
MTASKQDLRIGDRWPILIALMFAVLVIMLDNTVLNVALPTIGRELQAGASQLQWVVMAYSLTFGGLLLTTGNLADRVGRKRTLVIGLAIMAAGSALVLLAHNAALLVAIRALVGVGAALAMPSTLSLIYTTFTGPIRPKAVGLWSAISMAGVVLGPLVGGLMLGRLDWRWLFLLNLPVAAVAVPLVLLVIPESKDATGEPVDLPGALTSIGALASMIYAISSGPDHGWTSGPVLVSFGASAVLLVLFGWRELTAQHPMVDLRAILTRAFVVPAVVEGAAFFAMAAIMFIQTQLVQLVLGFTPFEAGLLTLPVVGVMVLFNGVLTRMATRVASRYLIAGGTVVIALGSLTIAVWPTSVWTVLLGMCLVMVGVRAALTTVAIEVIDALPLNRAGMGSALNDTFQEVGGVLGVGLLGALLNQAYKSALPADAPDWVRLSITGAAGDPTWFSAAKIAFAHGATEALTAGAIILLLVGVLAMVLHRSPPVCTAPASPQPLLAVDVPLDRG